ncbi:MAG: hypothetical protein ACFFE5_04045 [Candidatus Thorarchaeota archaeon]
MYKNPKYITQFKEINKLIEKDKETYLKSLDLEEGDVCDDFSLPFRNWGDLKDLYGNPDLSYVISSPKIFDDEEIVLEFWESIAKKYFFDEPILIDQSEQFLRDEIFMLYKGEKIEPSRPIGIVNLVEDFYKLVLLNTYDKPFSYISNK